MALRAGPIEQGLELPDGRAALVRVGLLDGYVTPAEQTTVALELLVEDEVVAGLNTVLAADDESGAAGLVREAVRALGSGAVSPTAEALERLVDAPR